MTTYLTTEQAAEVIGMSADYVARQCKSGAIKAKKLGTEWRIHRDALDQFMGTVEPAPPTRKRLSARQMRRAS
jgi:excisionase family DNA binding protein